MECINKRHARIAAVLAAVQLETDDPPGWEFDMVVRGLATYFMDEAIVSKRIKRFDTREFIAACNVNSSPATYPTSFINPERPRGGERRQR